MASEVALEAAGKAAGAMGDAGAGSAPAAGALHFSRAGWRGEPGPPATAAGRRRRQVLGLCLFGGLFRQLADPAGAFARAAGRNRREAEYRAVLRFMGAVWGVYPVLWAISDGRRGPTLVMRSSIEAINRSKNDVKCHR